MPRDRQYPFRNPHFLGAPPEPRQGVDSQISGDYPGEDPGDHFVYGPPTTTLQACTLGPPLVTLPAVEISYQVNNRRHHGYHLVAQSTGPFLVQIKVGSKYIFNTPQHSANVFGTSGSNPAPYLRPIECDPNDIVYFDLQDISGALNTVYISVIGVEK